MWRPSLRRNEYVQHGKIYNLQYNQHHNWNQQLHVFFSFLCEPQSQHSSTTLDSELRGDGERAAGDCSNVNVTPWLDMLGDKFTPNGQSDKNVSQYSSAFN